jgi:hypothetical protein
MKARLSGEKTGLFCFLKQEEKETLRQQARENKADERRR